MFLMPGGRFVLTKFLTDTRFGFEKMDVSVLLMLPLVHQLKKASQGEGTSVKLWLSVVLHNIF